ncbi:uncharacterized protein TNCV_1656481 [Trichonephila clavipes]|nr:uncharacterized protein TNCV_1656481 [Trichonephila clavipes]
MVEKAVGISKSIMKKAREDRRDYLGFMEYRNTPISGFDPSPAQMMFNRRLKTKLPISNKFLNTELFNNIREKLIKRQSVQKIHHDETAHPLPKVELEDNVIDFFLDLQDCVKDDVFMCDNGRCISKELICDGRNNCGDRSEESRAVCDAGQLGYFPVADKLHVIVFSILCTSIFIGIAVALSRTRRKRIVDTDSSSDLDEPTTRLAPFQAVHPTGFFISQNPAGPDSLYPHQTKVIKMEGGFSNPCYPNGIPQPPPPYSQ